MIITIMIKNISDCYLENKKKYISFTNENRYKEKKKRKKKGQF